ncbi:MAG: hypothetical protein KatS3mg105_3307 [Gemmatales bacterium]|nr:MAG: hypothetical protein KatS3mg105_3307 [Gemmatales bacterium]
MALADDTKSIKCKLNAAGALPLTASWVEVITKPGFGVVSALWTDAQIVFTTTNGTTPVTVVGTSPAQRNRKLTSLYVVNTTAGSLTFTLYSDDGTNTRDILSVALADGDQLQWAKGKWAVIDQNGKRKIA